MPPPRSIIPRKVIAMERRGGSESLVLVQHPQLSALWLLIEMSRQAGDLLWPTAPAGFVLL